MKNLAGAGNTFSAGTAARSSSALPVGSHWGVSGDPVNAARMVSSATDGEFCRPLVVMVMRVRHSSRVVRSVTWLVRITPHRAVIGWSPAKIGSRAQSSTCPARPATDGWVRDHTTVLVVPGGENRTDTTSLSVGEGVPCGRVQPGEVKHGIRPVVVGLEDSAVVDEHGFGEPFHVRTRTDRFSHGFQFRGHLVGVDGVLGEQRPSSRFRLTGAFPLQIKIFALGTQHFVHPVEPLLGGHIGAQ